MATKKTKKQSFTVQKLLDGSDSYKSLIYGIVTVVVLFVVVALGVNTLSNNRAQIDEKAANTEDAQEEGKYLVLEGETLWGIAEKHYNDGFKWNEIAKANNINDPAAVSAGDRLTIPTISPIQAMVTGEQQAEVSPTAVVSPTSIPTPTVTSVPQMEQKLEQVEMTSPKAKITGATYTVVRDDNLWEIAVRAYGDGYKWSEIARANNLSNPDLIFSGNVLKLPR